MFYKVLVFYIIDSWNFTLTAFYGEADSLKVQNNKLFCAMKKVNLQLTNKTSV